MSSRLNNFFVGLSVGVLFPILASFLYYIFMYKGGSSYLTVLMQLNQLHLFGILLSVSVLPNLLIAYLATSFEYIQTARGILYATGFYVVIATIYRFLF